ncbi:MAG: NAD(P)-dependent oxidoreductase [Anaerolineaceae bacterium]|nr:NAD(P)-dependent oxidoreductase [Anaerolineaceae bacterium]
MNAAPESKSNDCTLTIKPNIFASADLGDKSIEVLRSIRHLTYQNYLETGQILSGTELIQALKGAQIFITEMDVLDAATLSQLPDLRVVFVCRGNPVNIDIAACSAAGIPVINTPGRNADAVADLTLAYMLALLRRMPEAAAFLHEPGGEAGDMGRMTQAFTGLRGDELWNKVVGLVGCGAVGRKVVERLLPFGAKVMVYDPFLDSDQISLLGASKSSLEQLITQSDIISLHTAVNPETENMFSTEAFAQMKHGVYFINTARAALVNQPAMLQALKNGKIKGAALDVFAEEPPAANDPLILLENVIATPHIGGNTNQLSEHQGMILIDDLNLLMRGLSPKHILNPEVMSEFSWIEKRNVDLSKLEERKAEPGPGMRDLDVKSQLTKEPVRPADAPLMTASISQKLGEPYKEEPKTVFSAIKKLFGLAKPESTPQSVLHKDAEPKAPPQPLEQGMVPVLKNFLKGMESAPAIIEFSTGKQIIYTFTIKELEQPFYMAFNNGILTCDFGEPENPADVKLKMSASVLVDIIRARINPTKAAMTGKLSFSGDTAKALTLSKLNLKDVYDAACAKMGVSGEASSLLDAAQNSAIQGAAAQGSQTLSPAAKQESQANGFEELMAVFLGEMQNDEALKQFSEEKNILYTFTIKKMEKPFFMHFNNGVVKSALGEPESTPDVKLKMSAHVLVDIILGRINPTKAAMTGKLSFSGDTAKALALSKVNLKDAYLLASKTLGVSGEAAELLEKKGPASVQNKLSLPHTPVSAHAAEQTLQAAQKPNRVGDVRDEILDVLNELYQKGLVTSTGGNISARTDDNSNEFWITPAGVFKGDLSADKMVRIDLEGNVVGESDFSASSERHVHCAIYRNRPDIAAVIHSHSPNATLLGITGTPFLPISTEAAFIGDLPVAPFVMPGTKELSLSLAKAIGDKSFACILQNHGLVVAGTSPRKAADTTEIVEETCSKLLICRQMGVAPSLVPEEAVKQLKEMGAMLA